MHKSFISMLYNAEDCEKQKTWTFCHCANIIGALLIIGLQFVCKHPTHWTEGHRALVDFLIPAQSGSAAAELQGPQYLALDDHMVQSSQFHIRCQPVNRGDAVEGCVWPKSAITSLSKAI